jgi:hypothetical protein
MGMKVVQGISERSWLMGTRACAWMSGPADPKFHISAFKWWLAVSRGHLANGYRPGAPTRPAVTCARTPSFISPLHRSK